MTDTAAGSAPVPSEATPAARSRRLLYEGSEWNFNQLQGVYDAIEDIALGEMGLDVYPNQIEVITSEQMLDAYASIGMPLMYRHWSFGKHFAREEMLYRKGKQGLAYELVINSNPCVCYVMEENSITMQTLVLAHAAFGHNHFFKNNYMFRQWTDADSVLDELAHAKRYVQWCEERFGLDAVEATLDAAHAIMNHGVSRYAPRNPDRQAKARQEKMAARRRYEEETFNDLWRTVPRKRDDAQEPPKRYRDQMREREEYGLPEENLLLFLERHAPKLEDWQRELLAIVRRNAQYFYPQRQTKMMNEGCATYVHYVIMNRLYDEGRIDDGAMLEFLHSHSSVIMQPNFNDRRFGGLNPYALGFAMMQDLERIATEPTAEDEDWFPNLAGSGDAMGHLREAWADYRDESFILQYLSPKVMRDFRFFALLDDSGEDVMRVDAIHEERGYQSLRRTLAAQYDLAENEPDLQVIDANLKGNRRLVLQHRVRHGRQLDAVESNRVLRHLADLWGYRVRLVEVDADTGKTLHEYDALPMP